MSVAAQTVEVSPGSVVIVRDEEWLVTQARTTSDGLLIHVQGLSKLVRGQTAMFYESLDRIEVLDPKAATVRADESPNYRDARLWRQSTGRISAKCLSPSQPADPHVPNLRGQYT